MIKYISMEKILTIKLISCNFRINLINLNKLNLNWIKSNFINFLLKLFQCKEDGALKESNIIQINSYERTIQMLI